MKIIDLAGDPAFRARENGASTVELVAWVKEKYGFDASGRSIRAVRKLIREGYIKTAVENTSSSAEAMSDKQTKSDGLWTIELPNTEIETEEQFIAHYKIDLNRWRIKKLIIQRQMVASTPRAVGNSQDGWSRENGNIVTTKLCHIKAELEPKVMCNAIADEIAAIKAEFASPVSVKPLFRRSSSSSKGMLLELSIPDLHVGKLAWPSETGGAPYDVDIAVELFRQAYEDLIEKTSHYNLERILFVVGNDLLNADSDENMTTKGTPVSTDGRQKRTFRKVRLMTTEAIKRLSAVSPVDVLTIPGNHDWNTNFTLGEALDGTFEDDPHVNVICGPNPRKVYQYHRNMILFTHGNNETAREIALTCARDYPDMWAATDFREAHFGHLHKLAVDESHGFTMRWLPSLCPEDDWHAQKAFTGNVRRAEAHVWHPTNGLEGSHRFNIVPGRN